MNGYSYNGGFETSVDQSDQTRGDGSNGFHMMAVDNMRGGMGGGQSLDDIINNNKVMRRQSIPQQYGQSQSHADGDMRQVSMMDYNGGSPTAHMAGFGFDASRNGMDQSGLMAGTSPVHSGATPQHRRQQSRRQSAEQLALNTSFPNPSQSYNQMLSANTAYASPANGQDRMDMGITSPYMDTNMNMSMDYNVDQAMSNALGTDALSASLYTQNQFASSVLNSPRHQSNNNMTSARGSMVDSGGGSGMNTQYSVHSSGQNTARNLSRSRSMRANDSSPAHGGSTPMSQRPSVSSQSPAHRLTHDGFSAQPQHPEPGSHEDRGMHHDPTFDGLNGPLPVNLGNYNPNNQGFAWETPEGGWPSTMVGKPHTQSTYKNAYSSTGFDMLGVLMRVATRPNPEINIGSVDMSCAFVVCDAEKDDFPMVYCSDNFERLTGYTKHMILGRNCRFLQSPDGNVAPGVFRKYVDDASVLYMKNMINLRREAQISLINYRRGGQPFMNLLTIIPITWETEQVKYLVGFQVDLVEQPNAVTNKNPDGSYSINYQRGMAMPRYVMNAPDSSQRADLGQTVPRDDVSAILTTIGTGESEYAKRMWDKVLLENTDDVVHVLSLKGLFQWVSPSALRVLEYEPCEIIGTALSSVCHPSDIVPVTRELKDTSSGASVNVVFRIRRKNSGYMWFEGHGSLHTEQGKGRKSIIMVGRERPVYTLSKSDILSSGGIGENELWTKMSTSGMFLFVSSSVRQLLDRQPEDMVGISIQSMMRSESKTEFGRILEHARTGKKASVKHEMINRRGQVLSAYTTLYPGDATEGLKPTFIVAQTRLIRFSRGTHMTRPNIDAKPERRMSDSVRSVASSNAALSGTRDAAGEERPKSAMSSSRFVNTDGAAATYAGQNGLAIGHQDQSLASEENLFDELKTTKSSSWQYEIRQLEKRNRILAEEVQSLIAAKKKRKRRKGSGNLAKDCANCHTKVTPEWRRGPSGQRDLCNSCGLRWAKLASPRCAPRMSCLDVDASQNGRVSPRTSSQHSGAASDKASKASGPTSPLHMSGLHHSMSGPNTGSPGQLFTQPHATSNHATPTSVELAETSALPESHAAYMQGASGVPDKIDEDIEPD